jgi:hypothetical protein
MCLLPDNIKAQRVIVSPLNWGLGHATRLVPIVEVLEKNGNDVVIAGERPSIDVLRQHFPERKIFEFDDSPFEFDEKFFSLQGQLKFVKILRKKIKADKARAEKLARETGAQVIISDNRYGFFSSLTSNIIITHQLNPLSPYGKFADKVAGYITRKLLKPFDCVWVPDAPEVRLSGKLAWEAKFNKAKSIGILSRFNGKNSFDCDENFDVGIIISGPEPSRTIFEKKVVSYFSQIPVKSIVAGGKQRDAFEVGGMKYIGFASYSEVSEIINCSNRVVVRAGYSTIMDIWSAGKNAILVPTPHQTEQEYLAKYLSTKYPHRFTFLSEDDFEKIPYENWLELKA